MSSVIDSDTHVIESEVIWDFFDPEFESRKPTLVQTRSNGSVTNRWLIDPSEPADELVSRFQALQRCRAELPGPWRYLALIAEKQGRYGDCASAADRALELAPQSKHAAVLTEMRDTCVAAQRQPSPQPSP